MPLCIKLRDDNSTVIKVTHVPSGDVFHIDAGRYHKHGAQIALEGNKELFTFNRVELPHSSFSTQSLRDKFSPKMLNEVGGNV